MGNEQMNLIINNLDRNTDGDVITVIHWTATKEDGDFVASVYNTQSVEVGDTVIPFAEVTEELVKTWLTEKLDMESLEAALDAQIEAQKNPVTASGLPWATE
jgi:propanediol dehydratase small subunit